MCSGFLQQCRVCILRFFFLIFIILLQENPIFFFIFTTPHVTQLCPILYYTNYYVRVLFPYRFFSLLYSDYWRGCDFFSIAMAPLLYIRSWTNSITTAPYHPIFVRLSLLSLRPFPALDQCICIIKILPVRARGFTTRNTAAGSYFRLLPFEVCRRRRRGNLCDRNRPRLYYVLCLPS